jgi:molybdopterin synthase sulfur carrier subunit
VPVIVQLPQALAPDAGGQRTLAIDLERGSNLGELLRQVSLRHSALGRRICDETGQLRRFVNVYVQDAESRTLQGMDTPVPGDAIVLVVGSVAGG